MTRFVAMCACLVLGFCEQATEPASRKLDSEFDLRYGESAQIADADNVVITFKDLLEESRCPEGLVCVWAGNAKILLRIAGADSAVNTTLEPKAVTYQSSTGVRYTIKLLAVAPYPKKDVEVKKERYVVRLIVTAKQS